MSSPDSNKASETLLRAVELLRDGKPVDLALLRAPLAELLEDAAAGDDEGVVNPYATAVAHALLGPSA
ncbi:hypothetical protein ABZW47_31255 [Streptomyces sp. NPDC004549]|uniref:hypothetical protein n=1 Tax=Streptomyces sp. NPDC004549 TaxID=3154283 RepID=UPI0033B29A05